MKKSTFIRVKNIKDKDDEDLNGMVGKLVDRHPGYTWGDQGRTVGIVISRPGHKTIRANLHYGEFEKVY